MNLTNMMLHTQQKQEHVLYDSVYIVQKRVKLFSCVRSQENSEEVVTRRDKERAMRRGFINVLFFGLIGGDMAIFTWWKFIKLYTWFVYSSILCYTPINK